MLTVGNIDLSMQCLVLPLPKIEIEISANTFAPLPDGLYKVSDTDILASNIPEVGKTFIAIYPQFETERSDLGIHQDPSYNKRNGHDGTAGCIGLTTAADRDAVNNFVSKYHPRNLIVKIDTEI